MNQYRTADVARIIGVHVNTVRLYEKWGLISKAQRQSNGYRVFTDLHVEQFKLARAALKVEVLQNGLRKEAVNIVKVCASCRFEEAAELTHSYIDHVDKEKACAEEAIAITKELLASIEADDSLADPCFTRKQTADLLNVTIDTLRNWELNGLFTVKRKGNGYRMYSTKDLQQLKIIRALRCANYSLASILRMRKALSKDPFTDIKDVIDTPKEDDDIISACDKLLTSLDEARDNALYILSQIEKMSTLIHQPSSPC